MNIFHRQFRAFGAAVAAATALCATPASAAVLYEFSGVAGAFSLTSAQYISADTTVQAAGMNSCSSPSGPCLRAEFDVDGFDQGLYDVILFTRDTGAGTSLGSYHYFDLGAFGQNGTYATLLGINPGTLRISGAADPTGAVPEPATWALLILGMAGVGSAMRRRRANLAVSYA